jgi:hypothetical protein
MPKQNRVTPWGEIITAAAHGTLMGNRGCLHDAQQQIRKLYQGKRWIICKLKFKSRHRVVMSPGLYTELFFLDEATALAAGHRPCAECSREQFDYFRILWAQANPQLAKRRKPPAPFIDNVLHMERVTVDNQKVVYEERLSRLPNGSFVTLSNDEQAYLVLDTALLLWSPQGYLQKITRKNDRLVQVLTPRSIVKALAAQYRPAIHPTAFSVR